MQKLRLYFPLVVAAYVAITGIFFLIAPVLSTQVVSIQGSGKTVTMTTGTALAIAGGIFIYLFFAGKLKKNGKSIVEIRMEAIEKYDSPAMLAEIARNEPVKEIRQAAKRRLDKIST